jgi:uncharacterized cupin superfamily protein
MNRNTAAINATSLSCVRGISAYPKQFQPIVEGRLRYKLGDHFKLDQFGVNLTILEPGSQSALRHWHQQEDELIFILEGEVILITEIGEQRLISGMCAGFKAGVADGHHLRNDSLENCLLLEIGSRSEEEKVTYPDNDLSVTKTDGIFYVTDRHGVPFLP